jgi:hypothetical protein
MLASSRHDTSRPKILPESFIAGQVSDPITQADIDEVTRTPI